MHIQGTAAENCSTRLLIQLPGMTEKEILKIQKQIENFILGKLSQREIDLLWIEFLKAPEWYDLFEVELHLRALGRNAKN